MLAFLVRRLLGILPVLLGVTLLVFLLVHLLPGSPAAVMLGPQASPEEIERLEKTLGLDKPLPVQYIDWLSSLLRGDLGTSIVMKRKVGPLLLQMLPATAQLIGGSLLVAVLIGFPAGIISAVYRGTWIDLLSVGGAMLGISVPTFWLAILAVWLFSLRLGLLPATGYAEFSADPSMALKTLIMPAVVLGAGLSASIMRFVRSSMLEVIGEDYIRTARSKGLSATVVYYRHALKNAMIPAITNIGLQVGALLGSTPIIERIFSRPGLANFLLNAVHARDYILIQGIVLFIAILLVLINLVVDLTYGFLDPRIRFD